MKQEILARTIIETLVNKFFRDVRQDPDRSIRNMIDLGINFAKGRFQKEFFQILQEMLQKEDSAYYALVKNTVANTDPDRLKTFGINVGFHGCTTGANTIRECEARWNFNIPWAFSFPYGTDGLAAPYADRLISEGKEMGSYVYILTQQGTLAKEHLELFERHQDCAFVLRVPARTLMEEELIIWLKEIPNCLILAEEEPALLPEVCDELRKQKLFYGICRYVEEAEEEFWATEHLEQIAETQAAFYILFPKDPYCFRENEEWKKQVKEFRRKQEYPFILIDYSSDVQHIDRIISGDSCAVSFDQDGFVYTDTGIWKDADTNICHRSLFDILAKVTRKDTGAGF